MIEVQNLVKMYGKHMAVDHLSFTVEKGQVYGFLGPNGVGKSTTMNIMTGYLGATEGKVLINGHDILKEPEAAKRCIGYLPEQPPLYMEMTVLEYLAFAAELKKIPSGEREGQIKAVMELTKLAKNHTVILSSHILAEVREVCDYIMIISSGKLVASDDPEKLEKKIGGEGFVEIQARATAEEVKGVPLLEITRTKTTLEEVFLELTQGNAAESEEQMYDSDI